jgi:GNAT superfamily N-acetyltransferase
MRRYLIYWLGGLLCTVVALIAAAWAFGAVWFDGSFGTGNKLAAALVAAALVVVLLFVRPFWRKLGIFVALFAGVLAWWLTLSPTNDSDWQPDVAQKAWADIQGDEVTLHNVRNCDYRSETDYTVRHYDKTFDLDKLKSIDLSLVYWGPTYIAHTMLSFGFEGDGFVCFSVETRKEIGETYSTIKGFFRQYELTCVVADERDLIGLRTNYRGEQVYLYRLNESADIDRKVFLDYLRKVNSLKDRPEWYNALTDNCTTSIRSLKAPFNPDARLDWRIIVNGFIDEMLYERKMIDTSLPFPELKKRSLINERAKGVDKSPDFSRLIRVGLPGKKYQVE